jgi:adenylyltransferase/sulfurtransferase
MPLSAEELRRYSRQIILPELGVRGQEQLSRSRVLVVGVGGLGGPVAMYLAAAGIGELGVIDPDQVEASNLHRQVLYRTEDVGEDKVQVAARNLQSLNPNVQVRPLAARLDVGNALEVIAPYDLVLDGTDNFSTRYLVNDACALLGKRNVFASVLRFDGQLTVLGDPAGPCYRCLYPDPPPPGTVPSCAEAGVIGVMPGLMGVLQATEAIKLLAGIGTPLVGRLLLVDARRMSFREMRIARRAACEACGTRTMRSLVAIDDTCEVPAVAGAVGALIPRELQAWRTGGRTIQLVDVREPWEHAAVHLAGARLLPLSSLSAGVGGLDPTATTVLYCHHGARSRAAAAWLVDHGFRDVWNLEGGIDRWSLEVDPSLPRY